MRGNHRGEYKVPGGKLVAVTIQYDKSRVSDPYEDALPARPSGSFHSAPSVHIDGDFFIDAPSDAESDALIGDIEETLTAEGNIGSGEPESLERSIDRAIKRHSTARLIGCDAAAIVTAFRRAADKAGGHAAIGRDAGIAAAGLAVSVDPTVASGPTVAFSPTATVAASSHDAMSVTADRGSADRESADFARRWKRLRRDLVVIHDTPRSPAEQMEVDERWAHEVAAGLRPPTLRIWEWSGPCVVVGRFQSIPDEVHEDVARAEGIEVVRRCTGGGAMFIEPGNTITYSLYAPLWFVDGIDVADSYRLCDRWLVDALAGLGLDVRFSGLNDIASSHGKIGGAAQRRFPASGAGGAGAAGGVSPAVTVAPGAVLHHVTMAYDIDAAKMTRVLNTSGEKLSDKAVKSAVKRVDPLKSQTGLTRGAIIARLIASLADPADPANPADPTTSADPSAPISL
ncbi:lipoate--protein ligase family protein [Bifidobacterium rousetti]|uniref:lipoate--protein ligase family protein n=1 Tax=Bifidobacterium rousetti TaxID=2045439 RepID=UPI00123A5B28|nr:lipoate--protein ligase family protein [Bifidobacterium rousetti]